MNASLDNSLTVFIEPDAHRYATVFASEQVSPAKGKQVYLNTLAVYAVRTYLGWLSVPTDLSGSDCWHQGLRALFDVADLVLPKIGKLECRPILPGDTEMLVAPTAPGDRLGHIAVSLSEDLKQAALLGFLPAAAVNERTEAIALTQLRSLEDLVMLLQPQPQSLLEFVNLRGWLEQRFTSEWHPTTMRYAVRSNVIHRSKELHFEETNQRVTLELGLTYRPAGESHIQLRFLPAGEATILPQSLQVLLVDANEQVCAEAIPQENNDRIQMDFDITNGEAFSLQITLEGQTIIEKFQL